MTSARQHDRAPSEYAFNRAFSRHRGQPPGRYRAARGCSARVLGLTVRMTVTEPGAMPQRATRHVTLHPPR
jgi:AraC-like DNA-binding protein